MIRRPTCAGRLNATEPKFSQIEGRNEGVDHPNRIVICNPVIQAFRQQSRLPAISPLNEATHAQPPPIQCGIIADTAFSHSQGQFRKSSTQACVFRCLSERTPGGYIPWSPGWTVAPARFRRQNLRRLVLPLEALEIF